MAGPEADQDGQKYMLNITDGSLHFQYLSNAKVNRSTRPYKAKVAASPKTLRA